MGSVVTLSARGLVLMTGFFSAAALANTLPQTLPNQPGAATLDGFVSDRPIQTKPTWILIQPSVEILKPIVLTEEMRGPIYPDP